MQGGSYCVRNKQYSKEECEKLCPRIIEHMRKTGEWGEYFKSRISQHGYNKTTAQLYYPLTREQALAQGFKWDDYEVPPPKVERIIPASDLPDNIKDVSDDILDAAIECEVTKKPFRIIPKELKFYRRIGLPLPRRPDQRHLTASRQQSGCFWKRSCDKCGKEMMTTWSKERPVAVYCEKCYTEALY